MDGFKHKVYGFVVALKNVYRKEEEREEIPKLELKEELTEDITAMLTGMYVFYRGITESDEDLISFTHLLNHLAVQYIMEENKKNVEDRID